MKEVQVQKLIAQAREEKSTELDLSGMALKAVPLEVCQLMHLTRLNLDNNNISELPTQFTKLCNLETLRLSGNQLTDFPLVICELTSLGGLYLSNNQLSTLPPEIGRLDKLEWLILGGYEAGNHLTTLPEEMAALTNLTHLNLGGNRITQIPLFLCELSTLSWLDLGGNEISELPRAIGGLVNLSWLGLGKNRLSSIPREIGNLLNLKELYLGGYAAGNLLRELPSEIGQLARLQRLVLGGNQLSKLPAEIGNLSNLRHLDLGGNELQHLPPEICNLVNLKTLNLSKNRLSRIPEEIGNLSSLEELVLGGFDAGNQLTTLPGTIGELDNLTLLVIGSNNLHDVPEQLWNLHNLKHLDIGNNQLRLISPKIENLRELETLQLSGNELESLPTEIGLLKNLKELEVSGNHLRQFTLEICQLTNLVRLNLGNNEIARLPSEIGHLERLSRLDLPLNKITSIPKEIGSLSALTWLDLSGNRLMSLPAEILNLSEQLTYLDLHDNPLPIPPETISRKNQPSDILAHYRRHFKHEPTRNLNEAKLLLVGDAGAGKTSLVRRIVEDRFDIHEPATDRIRIQKWQIGVGEREVSLNIWDFGGQDVMHAIHQFFLTKRSLYLLVVDARPGEPQKKIEYWLRLIESYAGDAPVIIVLNKIDNPKMHYLALDQRGLQYKFPGIKAFVRTSCLRNSGIIELKEQIRAEVVKLEHISIEWTDDELVVKTSLEQMEHDYISYADYVQLCESADITDESDQRSLIQLLHDLGNVLNFQSDPRLEDTNILNPLWLTDALYQIVASDVIANQGGVLKQADLSKLLDPKRYPRDKQLFIIDMMREFELCYAFDDMDGQKFLIPSLLPVEQPNFEWDRTKSLAFQYHYSILPNSVISRFIARVYRHVYNGKVWRNGVLLCYEHNEALVEVDYEEKRIHIWVRGNEGSRRAFLSTIRFHFGDIHSSMPKIEVEEIVPLPGKPDVLIKYSQLLLLENRGRHHIYITETDTDVLVSSLLDGVGRPQDILIKLRTILSAHFDEGELITLSSDLGLDYSDLPGSSKVEKARELVLYFHRRETIRELLIPKIREERPKLSWQLDSLQ